MSTRRRWPWPRPARSRWPPPGPGRWDDVKRLARERDLGFVLCSYVEMSGAPKAKLVPATHLEDMDAGSAGFAGFAAGEIGQGPHDPDMTASRTSARCWCALAHESGLGGEQHPGRRRLALLPPHHLAAPAGAGHAPGVRRQHRRGAGVHAPQARRGGRLRPRDAQDTLGKPCYDLRALHRNLDLLTTLIKYVQELGWDPYANDHEDANCQFELNYRYADALTTADRHTFFKWMVKSVAEQQGLVATFMPKPFAALTGNGAHCHLSLWDPANETNLFLDEQDGRGLSQLAYWFTGGVLHHARALAAVTNPLVNSYKRLIRGAPRSGATWAPVYTTYGGSNRTQMIRIPAPGRIESHRGRLGQPLPGVHRAHRRRAGRDRSADPGPGGARPSTRCRRRSCAGGDRVPAHCTLNEALDCLEGDQVIRDALGPDYASAYLRAKREEWERYIATSRSGNWTRTVPSFRPSPGGPASRRSRCSACEGRPAFGPGRLGPPPVVPLSRGRALRVRRPRRLRAAAGALPRRSRVSTDGHSRDAGRG